MYFKKALKKLQKTALLKLIYFNTIKLLLKYKIVVKNIIRIQRVLKSD
jgi:hypothetical protein